MIILITHFLGVIYLSKVSIRDSSENKQTNKQTNKQIKITKID
jgi:hypothetical protein